MSATAEQRWLPRIGVECAIGTGTIRCMTSTDWRRLSEQLVDALALTSAPIAITFTAQVPPGIPAFDEPMSPPTEDGRSGRPTPLG